MKNRQPLCHDAGKLLRFLLDRMSIPRERWNHEYVYLEPKKKLPSKKKDRKLVLVPDIERLAKSIRVNQPCVVVGMGKLPCECLLENAPSILKKRAGTVWPVSRMFREIGVKNAWVSYSTDAALFDPVLAVGISRVLGKAARQAEINIELNREIKMFDWSRYL